MHNVTACSPLSRYDFKDLAGGNNRPMSIDPVRPKRDQTAREPKQGNAKRLEANPTAGR
jgi:hypothetical protein